jgi:creatinine amidohydrolase
VNDAIRPIPYADLTWPEVEALPRDLPLVVPIGEDEYDWRRVAIALRTDSFGVLPPVPYGFPTREPLGALAVTPALLRKVLLGTIRQLRVQAFRTIVVLDGHNLARSLAGRGLRFLRGTIRKSARPRRWPPDIGDRVVVISTGHTEQHALHLPLETDTRIVAGIAEGLQDRVPDRVVCLPAWPYGASTHTQAFPGTLNLGGRLFEDFFLAVVERLVGLGARKILFSNGHGGNHSYLVNVVKWAGERWPDAFTATEWLHTTGPALEALRQTPLGGMGHAGELETSLMLCLRPDLVRMERARPETDFIATSEYFMDWSEGGRLIANPPWSDDTVTGAYGDPTSATAEKGRRWLQAAVDEKIASVEEISEQQRRRQARRKARVAETVGRRQSGGSRRIARVPSKNANPARPKSTK